MCAKAADGIKINLNWASKGRGSRVGVRDRDGGKSWEDALAHWTSVQAEQKEPEEAATNGQQLVAILINCRVCALKLF